MNTDFSKQHPYTKYAGTPNWQTLRDLHLKTLGTDQTCEELATILGINYEDLSWNSESSKEQAKNNTFQASQVNYDSGMSAGDFYKHLRGALRPDLLK